MLLFYKYYLLVVLSVGLHLNAFGGPLISLNIPWPDRATPAEYTPLPPITTDQTQHRKSAKKDKDDAQSMSFAERRLQKLAKKQMALVHDIEQKANPSEDTVLQQRAQELVAAYENLITDNPDFLLAYLLYGKLLRKVSQDRRAYAIFSKANELDPNLPVVKQQLAALLAEKGEFEQSLLFAIEAVALRPETAVYHYQLAEVLYIYRDRFVEQSIFSRKVLEAKLVQAFDEAVRLSPDEQYYRLRRAKAYYHLENTLPNKALEYWDTALIDAEPGLETDAIQLHRADLLAELGRRQEALDIAKNVTHSHLQISRQEVLDKLTN